MELTNRPLKILVLLRIFNKLYENWVIETVLILILSTYFSVSKVFFKITIILIAGPAFIVSTTSLVMNILLIGGAKQGSKEMLLGWVVWKIIAIVIFWLW